MQQLLNYQKEVYSRQTKYTPIVPVVFYHGKKKWNIRTSFAQLDSEDLLPYTLNFGYILIDLQEVDLTKIRLSLTSSAILHIFSQIWEVNDIDKLNQYIRFIKGVIRRDSSDKLLKLILVYIYRVHSIEPKQVKKLIENIAPEKGEIAMTTAERLEKRGIEKGREEGKREAKIEFAKNFFKNGVSIEIIVSSTGLSKEELRKHGIK